MYLLEWALWRIATKEKKETTAADSPKKENAQIMLYTNAFRKNRNTTLLNESDELSELHVAFSEVI